MPYFDLGNLEDLHHKSPITADETIDILFQALCALQYLHPRGVAHRDLKPENILVESRSPLRVKLADFGLANDKPDLKTLCGTQLYTAPEVYLGEQYTTLVDLWSLGVIVFEYAYGLPEATRRKDPRTVSEEWGLAWCRRIVERANDWDSDSDALLDLLTTGMLRLRPGKRLNAGACLTKGNDLRLFDSQPIATPTLLDELSDDDGTATILLDALGDPDPTRPRYGGKSQSGYLNPNHNLPEPRNFRAVGSLCDEDSLGLQLGSFESTKAESTILGGSKRQRSPVVGSTKDSSKEGRKKRRQSADDQPPESWALDSINSGSTNSSAQQFGLTYPSGLLDCVDISGCSVPAKH